ncbi:MAG: TFIIB-type zinc ribbon-containing protein [Hungatella sp.]
MTTVTYKCPSCGGGLTFDPATQTYKCEYCLSDYTQEQLEALETDKAAKEQAAQAVAQAEAQPTMQTAAQQPKEPQALLYTCPSCGAEIVTDETTAASFCFYCQNPVVLAGKLEGKYHPDFVLPFTLDKEKATKIFTDWIAQKKYVPKAFFAKEQIEKMTGVYFPYWLYSCQVDGSLDAEGLKLRTWVAGTMQYTETQKFGVTRQGNMKVEHVTRNALKKADKQLVEGVLPFDMKGLKPFSMGYLSGFVAEKRDMEEQDFAPGVEEEVKSYAASNLQSSIGEYSSVSVQKQETNIVSPEWRYALMPVWTLTYREKKSDKIYYFACNGQTGKICGKLPVDITKLGILFAEIFLPLAALLLAVGYWI